MTQLCSSQTLCRAAATAILFSLAVLPASVAAQSGVETFVLFDPRAYLTNVLLKAGHHGLTVAFTYFSVVYDWASIAPS